MNSKLINEIYELHKWNTFGKGVFRPPAADPQNVWQSLFRISGFVWLTGLVAIRTVAQAGGAATIQFQHSTNPTILDDGTTIITGDPINTIYTLSGDPTDPVFSGVNALLTPMLIFALFNNGDIQVTMTAAAGTGSTCYYLLYIPISEGALIYPV